MEPLIKPIKTVKYELAYKILTRLLEAGRITKAEFDKIDALNSITFGNCTADN